MDILSAVLHQMDDLHAPHQHQMVGQQTTVATPPHRLAAHHRRQATDVQESVHPPAELLSLHVVGVRLERRVTEGGVSRSPYRAASPTEIFQPGVSDPRHREPAAHLLAPVLRVVSTSGIRPDIDHLRDTHSPQERCELVRGESPVTDGEDSSHLPRLWGGPTALRIRIGSGHRARFRGPPRPIAGLCGRPSTVEVPVPAR